MSKMSDYFSQAFLHVLDDLYPGSDPQADFWEAPDTPCAPARGSAHWTLPLTERCPSALSPRLQLSLGDGWLAFTPSPINISLSPLPMNCPLLPRHPPLAYEVHNEPPLLTTCLMHPPYSSLDISAHQSLLQTLRDLHPLTQVLTLMVPI